MDFFNVNQQGLSDTELSALTVSAPQWSIHGNINPRVRMFNPYITRMSISSLSTSLTFINLQDTSVTNTHSPTRQFFAPHTYTIYNISASISGSPYSYKGRTQTQPGTTPPEIENPLRNIGEPVSPWENDNESTERTGSSDILAPPVLGQSFSLPRAGNIIFNIDYTISPASSSELQFMSGHGRWSSADEVNWNDVQSVITNFSGNTNINFRINHSSGLFSNAITLSGLGVWRDYSYINEEAEAYRTPQTSTGVPDPQKIEEARRQQYRHTRYSSSYSYNGTLRPLLNDPIFSQSNFQYDLKGTMVHSKRYADGDGPELTPIWGGWVKEDTSKDIYGLNIHRFSSNISALLLNKQQDIRLSVELPPIDPIISTNATFRFWISETNVNFRIRQMPQESLERPGEWIYDPVYFTETLRFTKNHSFIYRMIIKPEENNDITNITATLSLWNTFKTEFTATKTRRSEFAEESPGSWKWVDYGDPVLQPDKLSLSYNQTVSEKEMLKNILNFSVEIGTSLNYNLIKHTSSNFEFRLALNFKITNFMLISLKATSDNSVIFRYFKNVPGMENLTFMYPDGRQNNIFLDLIDSFNFGDDAARRRSGFKMKSYDLNITHYLGDWEAILEFKMYSYLNNQGTIPRHEMTSDITFKVQWKPISELKTNIGYDGRSNRWSSQ
jgi:hypothetical protein